ncbi:hypothetical protein JAO29_01345 [Edaphobacter sp. HDX4]|uniref:hypothetical protein n=1 Tax=Edaphobacter sp. HDX4 TaxID=2794064 RepID=UPI002FE5651B
MAFAAHRVHHRPMRNFAWIWFVGFAAWLVDGFISLHYRSMQHAQLAFLVAMVFLAAGFFYRRQQR